MIREGSLHGTAGTGGRDGCARDGRAEWTDKTGKFKVVAFLVELDGDEVVLRRKDLDKEIRVPMSQLSSTDRRYLKDLEK